MAEKIINSRESLNAFIEHTKAQFEKHKFLRVTIKNWKQRTLTQNRALHKYCELLAEELNRAGYDMKKVLKPSVDISWTPESVKNHLWRPIQKAVTGHESTIDPKTNEYSEVYEHLSRHLSAKLGIYVPWPSRDNSEE